MSFYFPKANTIPGIRTSFSRAPSPSFTFLPPDSTEWLRSRFLDVRGAVSNLRHSVAYIIFAAKLSAFFPDIPTDSHHSAFLLNIYFPQDLIHWLLGHPTQHFVQVFGLCFFHTPHSFLHHVFLFSRPLK